MGSKKSAPGPDGWTYQELAQLPVCAWQQLQHILRENGPRSLQNTLMGLYKRAPLEKVGVGYPKVSEIRPIDIFSVVLRVFSSGTAALLKEWLRLVLNKGQLAAKGGAQLALSMINVKAERVLHKCGHLFAVSLDLKKLFNSLSHVVAARVARHLGLDQKSH